MGTKIRVKRRHTEDHPEVYVVPTNGKIRNEILTFLGQKSGECPLEEYFTFVSSLKDKLELGYEPKYWHSRFPKYVTTHKIDGVDVIRLTRVGNNFYNNVIKGQ